MAEENRLQWNSRLIFLFAAIVSVIGLGNLWRFPYLAYIHGGGSFIISYIILFLAMGIPLLLLEYALGQKMQRGAIGSFKAIDAPLRGIGFLAISVGAIIALYYAMVMAWSLIYLVGAFQSPLPWSMDPEKFFLNNVLQRTDGPSHLGQLGIALIISLALVWTLLYLAAFKGIKSVGKIVLVALPLSFLLLLIFFLRVVTLEGALLGIAVYVKPNLALLLDPTLWIDAAKQVFFSLSLGFGIMVTYASYNKKSQGITRSALAIALLSALFSLLSGFVIFGALGHLSFAQNLPLEELAPPGPLLIFASFAGVLGSLPMAGIFSSLFFLVMVMAGLGFIVAVIETIATAVQEKYRNLSTSIAVFVIAALGFLFGLFFTTGAGTYFLDIIDHYVGSYVLVAVGLLECLAVGRLLGAEKLREYVNSISRLKVGKWWSIAILFIVPSILGLLILFQAIIDLRSPYGGYPIWAQAIGWTIVILLFGIAAAVSVTTKRQRKKKDK